jgi:hypothetical protein
MPPNVTFMRTPSLRETFHGIRSGMVRSEASRIAQATVVGAVLLQGLVITNSNAQQATFSQQVIGGSQPVTPPAPVIPTVTSDSPEYCGVLMDRISDLTRTAHTPPPTEVASLSEDGERMCVLGQTRAGILRLRRALMIMRHGAE